MLSRSDGEEGVQLRGTVLPSQFVAGRRYRHAAGVTNPHTQRANARGTVTNQELRPDTLSRAPCGLLPMRDLLRIE